MNIRKDCIHIMIFEVGPGANDWDAMCQCPAFDPKDAYDFECEGCKELIVEDNGYIFNWRGTIVGTYEEDPTQSLQVPHGVTIH